MKKVLFPAAVFHASEIIADEAIARGWSLWDFAERIGALDSDFTVLEWQLYALCDPDLLMGEPAPMDLERVFGISADFWRRTEALCRRHPSRISPLPRPLAIGTGWTMRFRSEARRHPAQDPPPVRESQDSGEGVSRSNPRGLDQPHPEEASEAKEGIAEVKSRAASEARRKQYAQKLAAYKRSETYRIVEARANGQCEYDQMPIVSRADHLRCDALRAAGDRLTHHHKTYARFGGKELPEDIAVLCDTHNAHVESQHPTRNRNYR